MKTTFKVGDIIRCNNVNPLEGNTEAPDLVLYRDYPVVQIIQDKEGNDHLDVGLWTELNYVRSWETKEILPQSDTIHWCHPSRFDFQRRGDIHDYLDSEAYDTIIN